jgi:hypothetical protein
MSTLTRELAGGNREHSHLFMMLSAPRRTLRI